MHTVLSVFCIKFDPHDYKMSAGRKCLRSISIIPLDGAKAPQKELHTGPVPFSESVHSSNFVHFFKHLIYHFL